MVEYSSDVLNLIGIVVSVSVPIILIRFFHTSDARRIEKDKKLADDLKSNTERIAMDLKSNEERIARELKIASVDIAEKLQVHLDAQNSNIMQNIETISNTIVSLGERVDKISIKVDELSIRQTETQKDQLALIKDLQHRADLTNGNIQHIRNDIMDVQDVADNISDRMKQQAQHFLLGPSDREEKASEQTAREVRNKDRRIKRKEIEDDALSQQIDKNNMGRRYAE